jgi:hypothetical protein
MTAMSTQSPQVTTQLLSPCLGDRKALSETSIWATPMGRCQSPNTDSTSPDRERDRLRAASGVVLLRISKPSPDPIPIQSP